MYSGFWSYNLLWQDKNLNKNIKDVEKKYKIKI